LGFNAKQRKSNTMPIYSKGGLRPSALVARIRIYGHGVGFSLSVIGVGGPISSKILAGLLLKHPTMKWGSQSTV